MSNTRQRFDQTSTASPPAHFCDSTVAQVVCKFLQDCMDFSTPVFHLYKEYLYKLWKFGHQVACALIA
jgi:hypothetical protein